jgi:hypothetical protein
MVYEGQSGFLFLEAASNPHKRRQVNHRDFINLAGVVNCVVTPPACGNRTKLISASGGHKATRQFAMEMRAVL